MNLAVVIMAAGMGTRMNSRLPKVLHPVLGKPLLRHVVDVVKPLEPRHIVAVVGHQAEKIQTEFGNEILFAHQIPQLGTGHAVQQAQTILPENADTILVIPGDLPLLTSDIFRQLLATHQNSVGVLSLLTVERDNPQGFGRIVRNQAGTVVAVVEEADCTPTQKAIKELNVGVYLFQAEWLWANLPHISLSPKGEYYVTDLVELAVSQGYSVHAQRVADPVETLGINTRLHLAQVESALQQRVNRKWMEAGVTIINPTATYIGLDVHIGIDTIIYPNTYLLGNSAIGQDCVIGPNSFVQNSNIGDNCLIRFSVVEDATMENNVDIGPFSHLRKGAHLAQGVHMGNFGEVKNSYLGPDTKMGHFSYLGDITTGADVNIGAGTITCNYDGVKKNPTTVGDGAFIGSDTMLVAPVNIGKNAKTGAGSVVTKDVPDNALAYGVPARIKKSHNNPR